MKIPDMYICREISYEDNITMYPFGLKSKPLITRELDIFVNEINISTIKFGYYEFSIQAINKCDLELEIDTSVYVNKVFNHKLAGIIPARGYYIETIKVYLKDIEYDGSRSLRSVEIAEDILVKYFIDNIRFSYTYNIAEEGNNNGIELLGDAREIHRNTEEEQLDKVDKTIENEEENQNDMKCTLLKNHRDSRVRDVLMVRVRNTSLDSILRVAFRDLHTDKIIDADIVECHIMKNRTSILKCGLEALDCLGIDGKKTIGFIYEWEDSKGKHRRERRVAFEY